VSLYVTLSHAVIIPTRAMNYCPTMAPGKIYRKIYLLKLSGLISSARISLIN
jgi:hypothetical protein